LKKRTPEIALISGVIVSGNAGAENRNQPNTRMLGRKNESLPLDPLTNLRL
jgi:hypothetical protein